MRPSKDTYFLRHAAIAAQMSTCKRRSVGCVLVNARRQILAVGFNGVPSGMPHCNEGHTCPGADAPSGTQLSACFATHAEVNAVIQCKDPYAIDTVYTTTAPCVDCTKFIMNTSAKRVVFSETYPHSESQKLWEGVGREWCYSPFAVGGFWSKMAPYPTPELTGTKSYRKETCGTCHGDGYVNVLNHTPEEIREIEEQHGILRPRPDPNCGKCGGTGKIVASVGGGCMGYDEERKCECVR